MKKIELYRPKTSVEKYGRVISIDMSGRQETKNPLNIGIVYDDKATTLGEFLQKLANENEKLRVDLELARTEIKMLLANVRNEFSEEIGKQKEINKLMLNAIKEEGVI